MIKNDAVLNEEIDPKLVRLWSMIFMHHFYNIILHTFQLFFMYGA